MRLHLATALAATAIYIAASGICLAADPAAAAQVDVNRSGVHVGVGAVEQTGPAVRARDLLALKVYNSNNEYLGKIEDLVMDSASGKVRYAVLSFGGFLGLGDKLFAVPWRDLKMVAKGTTSYGTIKEDHYILDIDKAALKNAPGFDKSHWPDFANSNWNADVDRFYNGQKPAQ